MTPDDKGHETGFIQTGEGGEFILGGDWTVLHAAEIEKKIRAFGEKIPARKINASNIKHMDTAGAWLIRKYFGEDSGRSMTDRQKALMDFLPSSPANPPQKKKVSKSAKFFIDTGKRGFGILEFLYGIVAFTGVAATRFLANILSPRHFRIPSIVRHIHETGIQAMPIVGLLAFLMSMVIFYQAANQLQKFGADIFTIDLTVISILREMGVLITAIMVSGRSGSAFAAEIGVMKLREEVDALRTMGMDPVETLVLPRLLALLIALPLLTFFANMVGIAGGGIMSQFLLDISFNQYIDRVDYVATPKMFFIGMIKAPIFALLIAIVCTYQGMSVTGSAESVGRLTTLAVVQSIFLVIMADALFSIIFSELGI